MVREPHGPTPATPRRRGRRTRFGASDAAAIEAAVLPYLDDAYNLARWLTPSELDAETAVERGMLKAMAEYRSFRDGDPMTSVLRSVHDTVYAQLHAPAAAPGEEWGAAAGDWSALAVLSEAGLTPQTLLAKVQAHHLDALLAALPVELREAVVLFELNRASYKQIAAIVGVTVPMVMSRLWQARYALVRLAARPGPSAQGMP